MSKDGQIERISIGEALGRTLGEGIQDPFDDECWREAEQIVAYLRDGVGPSDVITVATLLAIFRDKGAAVAFGLMGMAEAIRARPVECIMCNGRGHNMTTSFGNPRRMVPRDCLYCHGKGVREPGQ